MIAEEDIPSIQYKMRLSSDPVMFKRNTSQDGHCLS
jgi:hypothetical protein